MSWQSLTCPDDLPLVRELDHRASEGVDVRLVWTSMTGASA